MKRLIASLFLLSLLHPALSRAEPASCPELKEIRELIVRGERDEALKALECRRARNPGDIDTLRVLSDLHWWRLEQEPSLESASDALARIAGMPEPFKDEETLFHLSDRVHPSSLRIEGDLMRSHNVKGNDLRASFQTKIFPRSTTRLQYSQDSRAFEGLDTQTDQSFALGHVHVFTESFYLDGEIQYAPNPSFLPPTHFWIAPHWTRQASDVSFMLGTRRFQGNKHVTEGRMTWIQELQDNWTAGLSFQNIFTRGNLLSAAAILESRIRPRWVLRGDTACGQALEDIDIDSRFRAASLQLRYRFSPKLTGLATLSRYESDVRDESRAGLGAEFLF